MFQNLNSLLSGIIVGMIILQSTIIAPTIFTTLEQNNAGKLIRNIFPKLFKFIEIVVQKYFQKLLEFVKSFKMLLETFFKIFSKFLQQFI